MSEVYYAAVKRLSEVKVYDSKQILSRTASRFTKTPDEQLEFFDKEVNKFEKKIKDLCKNGDAPSVANQIKRAENRIKALERQLKNIKKAGATSNIGLNKWVVGGNIGKDFQKLTVSELKAELKAKGLSTSGKKSDLIERLKRGIETGAH